MFKHALDPGRGLRLPARPAAPELHRLVGAAIEELYADRLPEHFEMLAHHFSQADDLGARPRPTCSAPPRRRPRPSAFGRPSISTRRRCGRGRRLGDRVPATTLMAIHSRPGGPLLRRRRLPALAGGGRDPRGSGPPRQDRPAEADALIQGASALQWAEDFPAALERAREAIELAEAAGPSGRWPAASIVRGFVHAVSGEPGRREGGQRARARHRPGGGRSRPAGARAAHRSRCARRWRGEYRAEPRGGQRGGPASPASIAWSCRCCAASGTRARRANDLGEYDRRARRPRRKA